MLGYKGLSDRMPNVEGRRGAQDDHFEVIEKIVL